LSEEGPEVESDGAEVIVSLSTEEETTGGGGGSLWSVREGEGGEKRSLWRVAWKSPDVMRVGMRRLKIEVVIGCCYYCLI
jgi:hypothetical protein